MFATSRPSYRLRRDRCTCVSRSGMGSRPRPPLPALAPPRPPAPPPAAEARPVPALGLTAALPPLAPPPPPKGISHEPDLPERYNVSSYRTPGLAVGLGAMLMVCTSL